MSHGQWQPEKELLELINKLMKDSILGNDSVQEQVHNHLEALRTLEEFPRYLAYILSTSNDLVARIVSGITLKNVVKQRQGEISPEAYQQIYECSFSSFSDPELSIRNVAGNIVSTVLRYKFEFWPGAVDALLECMDGGNQFAAEGAFSALCKVCEDAFLSIETTDKGLSLRVVNKLISLLNNPIPRIRADSISALENFIFHRSQSMITNMRSFLNSILQLTADESLIVRTAVCKTLTIILEVSHEDLVPDMNFIMDFMCQCLNSDDCDLAMRGFGFWLECVKTPELRDHLETCLPRLVGLLVKRMSFTEEYIANYEAEDDDCEEEDQDKDIKPHHHKTIVHKHPQNEQTRRGNEASSRLTELQHDDDSDSSMDNDDDDDMFPGWSLRKCASITLDILTTIFDNELLAHIRPHLMRELNDSNWVHQECGILVLGTISSCRNPLLIEDFSKLFPFLFSSLKSPHPLIRAITCWTLSKYAFFMLCPTGISYGQYSAPDRELINEYRRMYFEPVIYGMLEAMLDTNKRVQKSACSSLALIVRLSEDDILPYLDHIVQTIENASKKYKANNLLILYDTICELVESVGVSLRDQKYVNSIMGVLYTSLRSTDDLDDGMTSLLECVSSVAMAFGPAFQPYAREVWSRNNMIIDKLFKCIENGDAYIHSNNTYKECIATSFDLMGIISHVLGPAAPEIIMNSTIPIMQYIELSLLDESVALRQSAFAIVGDFAAVAYPNIKHHLNPIMKSILLQVEKSPSDEIPVTNNAIWATGEIALKSQKEDFGEWIDIMARIIILILNRESSADMIKRNAAVSLGRMCLIYPTEMSNFLPYFLNSWCKNFVNVDDAYEKSTSFEGVYNAIKVNPMGATQDLSELCRVAVSWQSMPQNLVDMFREMLLTYKNGLGEQWGQIVSQWPNDLIQGLSQKCMI